MKKSEVIEKLKELIEHNVEGYDFGLSDLSTEFILDRLIEYLHFEPKYINPKFKDVSGKGDSWDYIHFCGNYPEHHFTHKNPRPEFYINGWEPEDE